MKRLVAIDAALTIGLLALRVYGQPVDEPKPDRPPPAPAAEPPTSADVPPTTPPQPLGSPDDHEGVWSPSATWRPVGAATYDAEELALAALLNMNATVATKEAATVSRSPGMVTVYGEQDIRRLGYYTLADLADVTVGYSGYLQYGEKVFETRGQKAGSFNNNKHLVLIDGIPVNHGRGNKAMIDENFPLFFANRVEFLRGPASALYGTGAFFGVVNIAPKELEEQEFRGFRAEGRAGFGTQQFDKRAMANAMYRDPERRAAIYASIFEKGPSAAYLGDGRNPDNRFWDNQRSEFLYLTYGIDSGPLAGLKAGLIYASKNGGLGESWVPGYSPKYDDLTWVQIAPYLKYERRLSRTLAVDGYLKVSRDIEKGTVAALPGPVSGGSGDLVLIYESSVSTYEALAELRWEATSATSIIGGLNANLNYQNSGKGNYGGNIQADPGPVFRENRRTLTSNDLFLTYSPFLQVTHTVPLLRGLHATAGARLDTGRALDATFSQLSPRVGVVQELTDFLSMKLLYGTALRAPGNKELGLNKEVRDELLNPAEAAAVRPETIRSLEGGVALNTSHVSANAAVFINETRDALDGRPTQGNDGNPRNIFTNTPGKIVARGAELELGVAASPDARVFANYAIAKAELEDIALPAPG